MENSAEQAGRSLAFVVFAVPALYFLVRAMGAVPRSRRLANLALACGLGVFVAPVATSYVPEQALIVLRFVLGLGGLGLAAAALVARRDGGCGVARPVIGVVLGVLHVANAGALLMFSSVLSSSNPWVYQAPDASYRLTLPSDGWRQAKIKPTPDGARPIWFLHATPLMQVKVNLVNGQSQEDFAKIADGLWSLIESKPERRATAKAREGTNAAGNAYRYFTVMDSGPEAKEVFLGQSFTWIPAKHMGVHVIFEGVPRMLSDAGRAAEMKAFVKSAETILLSVQ